MKKFITIFYLSFLVVFLNMSLFAQTVDPNAVDGQIYFQLKAAASVKHQGINGVVNVNKLAFINGLKDTYQVTQVRRPFYKTTDTKLDRKSTRLNSSHTDISRMPSSA